MPEFLKIVVNLPESHIMTKMILIYVIRNFYLMFFKNNENQIKKIPLFQFNDSREIISHLHDSQFILSRERGWQVDVVCGVGEEGHLEHHVVAFEQLYGAVGVVVVEVEGMVFQCDVGAVGWKSWLVGASMRTEIVNVGVKLELQCYGLCRHGNRAKAEEKGHDGDRGKSEGVSSNHFCVYLGCF